MRKGFQWSWGTCRSTRSYWSWRNSRNRNYRRSRLRARSCSTLAIRYTFTCLFILWCLSDSQKYKSGHLLIPLLLFQTCMTDLCGTQKKIFWRMLLFIQPLWHSLYGQKTLKHFSKYHVPQKKVLQLWKQHEWVNDDRHFFFEWTIHLTLYCSLTRLNATKWQVIKAIS